MHKNKRVITMISPHKLVFFLFFISNIMAIRASDDITYPRTARDMCKINLRLLDNSQVRERFIQTVNEVDYAERDTCIWCISKKLSIGSNEYYILFQDIYHRKYYYLCRKPDSKSFPQMIRLCYGSMAGDTLDDFEIDEQNDRVTIIHHNDISTDESHPARKIHTTRKSYSLSNNFKLLENIDTTEVLDVNHIAIDL